MRLLWYATLAAGDDGGGGASGGAFVEVIGGSGTTAPVGQAVKLVMVGWRRELRYAAEAAQSTAQSLPAPVFVPAVIEPAADSEPALTKLGMASRVGADGRPRSSWRSTGWR